MAIEVQVGSAIRRRLNSTRSIMAEGNNVREVIDSVESQYPGFKSQIVNDKGELFQYIMIVLDDEDVRFKQGLDTKLEDGTTIAILPALIGG